MEIDLSSPCNLSSEGLQQLKHQGPCLGALSIS